MPGPIRAPCRLAVLLLCALCITGCAQVRNGILSMHADATDILRADVSTSLGTDMGAHVMATNWLQLKSYSYEDIYRVGFGMRHIGVWTEEREDWWAGTRHADNVYLRSKPVRMAAFDLPARLHEGREPPFAFMGESRDEIGLGFHFLAVGMRLGVRPLEIVDLLLCPFGLDLCGDNMTWEERKALRKKKQKEQRPGEEGVSVGALLAAPRPRDRLFLDNPAARANIL